MGSPLRSARRSFGLSGRVRRDALLRGAGGGAREGSSRGPLGPRLVGEAREGPREEGRGLRASYLRYRRYPELTLRPAASACLHRTLAAVVVLYLPSCLTSDGTQRVISE